MVVKQVDVDSEIFGNNLAAYGWTDKGKGENDLNHNRGLSCEFQLFG